MARHKPGDRRGWQVVLVAHVVGGRYPVPARESMRFEQTEPAAKAQVIREAHIDAGVPPMRRFLRQSWPYTSAVEAVYRPG